MKNYQVLGCPVHEVSPGDAVNIIMETIESGKRYRVASLNPEIVVAAGKNRCLSEALATADLVTADGIGIVLALLAQGRWVPRVPGVDLAEGVMERLAQRKGRLYLLGSHPEVAVQAAERLLRRFPGLILAGANHGYFGADQDHLVVEEIQKARPHLLLAGMGSPRQETWLADHWDGLGVSVGISVGGGIDLWAGKCKRAPRWMRRAGLEWCYRALQEPTRWHRLKRLPVFLYRLLVDAEGRFPDGS